MPAMRKAAAAEINSFEIQEVQDICLTIQGKTIRFTGSHIFWTRAAMSRRIGKVKVVPVDPAARRTVSNAAKSLCELPSGPSIRALRNISRCVRK